MILEGEAAERAKMDGEHRGEKKRERESRKRERKTEGGGCSRILMNTKGNITFPPHSFSLFCLDILMVHCSKSLSCKQGISHHALGFWMVSVSPCGTAWLTGCTCSVVLIEQMICQFVMFIFSASPRWLARSSQPPS